MEELMKKAVVCGAGGFIGGHICYKLKELGYFVRGVDIKYHEFRNIPVDEFKILDLRFSENCYDSLLINGKPCDICFNFAANMGGMGWIFNKEQEIVYDNTLINVNIINSISKLGIPKYFFSSSVCVYRDMKIGEPELKEEDSYPAIPENEYGWEKLYAERLILNYARKYGFHPRIARFQNTYGPYGAWNNKKEKAPAAICRKVAEVEDGGTIDIWSNPNSLGQAVRSYTYIDDLIDGIILLVDSDISVPVNIGSPEYSSVNDLVNVVAKVAKKKININYIDGPVGVESRNFSNEKIYSLGWKAKYNLEDGIKKTYPWIEKQVNKLK